MYNETVNNRPVRFKAAMMYYTDITSQLNVGILALLP